MSGRVTINRKLLKKGALYKKLELHMLYKYQPKAYFSPQFPLALPAGVPPKASPERRNLMFYANVKHLGPGSEVSTEKKNLMFYVNVKHLG